jgi:hypothetical protein
MCFAKRSLVLNLDLFWKQSFLTLANDGQTKCISRHFHMRAILIKRPSLFYLSSQTRNLS